MIGTTLAHYEILGKLGSGGMGIVYRSKDLKLGREVALKVLPTEAATGDRLKRFEREARAVAALSHPNIVHLYSIEEAAGIHFITMELVRGRTLTQFLAEKESPSWDELIHIPVQISEGLAAAHSAGVVHRDLKPENIVIKPDGHVAILDFGLAKLMEPSSEGWKTKKGTLTGDISGESFVGGTLPYMSPEQALGKSVDARSDVFSFGVMLYELVAGRRPFDGDSATTTLARILETERQPLRAIRPDIPNALEAIVDRCLQKDPSERFQDGSELRESLVALERSSTSGFSEIPTKTRVKLHTTRRQLPLPAILVVLAVALALAAIGFFQSQSPSGAEASPPRHRQLTFSGKASSPAISPDGTLIAYVRDADKNEYDLVVQEVNSDHSASIFSFQASVISQIAWSPDNTEILMSTLQRGETGAKTYLISRLGGVARTFEPWSYIAAWSPDGARFAGSWPDPGPIHVFTKSTGAMEKIELSNPHSFRWGMDWSPVADMIALSSTDRDQRPSLWVIDLESDREKRVFRPEHLIYSVQWSPEGDAIYYLMEAGSLIEIWKLPVSPQTGERQGDPIPIVTGLEGGYLFDLALNGNRLVYTRQRQSSNLWLAEVDDTVSSRTVRTRPLTEGTFRHFGASFSPDGSKIVFDGGDGSTSNIFVMRADGSDVRQLTFMNALNVSPVWSPDGEAIAFGSLDGEEAKVWKVPASGGTPVAFASTDLSRENWQVAWAPGERILYEIPENQNFRFLDPETGEETLLLPDNAPGWPFDPEYSRDAQRVAFYWNRGRGDFVFSTLDLRTGSLLDIAPARPAALSPLIGWSNDDAWIYFLDVEDDANVIKRAAADGGSVETYVTLPLDLDPNYASAMTPDASSFVFVVPDSQSDVWLIENFDPARR